MGERLWKLLPKLEPKEKDILEARLRKVTLSMVLNDYVKLLEMIGSVNDDVTDLNDYVIHLVHCCGFQP